MKILVSTCTWGTVTVISFVSPTTSSAGLVVSTDAGLKSSVRYSVQSEENLYHVVRCEFIESLSKELHV